MYAQNYKLTLIIFLSALITGCGPAWVKVNQAKLQDPDKNFTINAPSGWVQFTAPGMNQKVLLTHDGLPIQHIEAALYDHDKAFSKIEKKSNENMLAVEVTELIIAEYKASAELANIEVISNEPAVLDGKNGFRLHLKTHNAQGLRLERVIYGIVDKKGVYTVAYEAPRLHYFERDLPTFEKVAKSFKRTKS